MKKPKNEIKRIRYDYIVDGIYFGTFFLNVPTKNWSKINDLFRDLFSYPYLLNLLDVDDLTKKNQVELLNSEVVDLTALAEDNLPF